MKMRCDYCRRSTEHTYVGKQEFPKYTLELYNCVNCQSTHSIKVAGNSGNSNDNNSNSGNGGYVEWTSGYN